MKDLSRLDTATGSAEGRWLEPVDLDGQKIGLRILVLGPDSHKYATLRDEVRKNAFRAITRSANGLEPEQEKLTEAENEAKFCAALTIDWQPIDEKDPITWEGKPLPWSEANANFLYLKAPIIRSQVNTFMESRRNFTKPELGDSSAPSVRASSSTGRAKKAR